MLTLICSQIGSILSQSSSFLDFDDDSDFKFLDRSFSDKPQNVSLEATSSTTIMVHWEPPFGESQYGSLLGYKIKFRTKSSKKHETISVEPNRHFYELTNLERSTIYMVKMWAIFTNGTGEPSEWQSAETFAKDLDETQVPDKPASLRARPDSTMVHLMWSPPKNRNILVKGYKIGWGIGVPDIYEQVIGSDQRSYTITKLQSSSEYVISLRAYNRMGDGQPIYETVQTTIESIQESQSPMIPPVGLKAAAISSTSVVLDWTDTDSSSRSSNDNRWYLARYTNNVHSSSPKYRYVNSTKTTVMIEDLKPDTLYEFAVRVIKNKRNSTWSMSVQNTTLEAVPLTAPRDLTIVPSINDDSSTINLHWQPPKQPNGQITGYVIFYTTDNTLQDRDWTLKVIFGNKLNTELTDLQPSSLYYFKIQARNNKGLGPMSAETSFKTLSAVVKVQEQSSNNVSISLFLLVLIFIFAIVLILMVTFIRLYMNNRNNDQNMKTRKGYLPAATSPGGKNINSRLNNVRDLKPNPPDLWIHHNDQVELKSIGTEKNNGSESPIMVRSSENSFAKIKKTNSTYGMNASIYDDINKAATSDNMAIATMRRSSTIRAKGATCIDHAISNGMINNMEPSTGLSRPLYPKTQFSMPRSHQPSTHMDSMDGANMPFNPSHNIHLYDPVSIPPGHMAINPATLGQDPNLTSIHIAMANSNNSYMSGNSSSSPHSVISNNTVLTNSSTATNITNSSTSPPNTSTIYMSNKRPPGHSLKSFGMPTPPPQLPSLATLDSMQNHSQQNNIYNSTMAGVGSPSKKFLLTTTNNLNGNNMCGSNSTLASNGKSATHFSDDNSISASFNADDLNQSMANLEGLMKDLNAFKPNGLGSC